METRKLQSVEGFVLIDLPDAETSVGPARLGAKLLAGNATNYAREVTYTFASLEQRRGGMTIGLKVDPADRDAAVASVAEELAAELASDKLVVDPGLRMPSSALGAFAANDPRNSILGQDVDGIRLGDELVGTGAAAVADRLVGLDGRAVAIEGLSDVSIGIARAVEARGGRVVRVSTGKGCVGGSFTAADLHGALREHGAEAPSSLGEVDKPWALWRGDGVDAIFCGGSVGALTAAGAPSVGETAVVGYGVAPIATKALALLRTAGAAVAPAFLSSLARDAVAFDADVTGVDDARSRAVAAVDAVLDDVAGHDDGVYVGACLRAEAFMRSWAEELPFGRPMA